MNDTDDTDVSDRLDRLESLVERQRDRIAALEDDRGATSAPAGNSAHATLTRRNALRAGGLLALLGAGVGTASADPQGQVGTESDPLQTLHAAELNGGVLNATGDGTEAVTAEATSTTALRAETEGGDGVAGVSGEAV
ncbi:MAG: hypothetical protein ACQETI_12375, partial [Halobacteriota archaeon]